jgi:hypothetical protein
VADGVNVGYDGYRVATEVTGRGATLVPIRSTFLRIVFYGVVVNVIQRGVVV